MAQEMRQADERTMSPVLSMNSTPKRKRGQEHHAITPIQFSFDLSGTSASDDGSSSPRSRVAHKFRGLDLASGGGAESPLQAQVLDVEADPSNLESGQRKRHKLDEPMDDVPTLEKPSKTAVVNFAQWREEPKAASPILESIEQEAGDAVPVPPEPAAIANLLPNPKFEGRRRAGTPPIRPKKDLVEAAAESNNNAEAMDIVDPVRAALTWREEEITIYDPNDEDDDGTGINGVGFRPTPAMAHARVMKRRQQMAEYRKREESDARARRSLRRHAAAPAALAPTTAAVQSRKVRFMDGESFTFIATT
jgi:hypothetical protein